MTITRVSIHAPARGATQRRAGLRCQEGRFNPRAREGRDRREPDSARLEGVSIHAPARGATCAPCPRRSRTMFQSTRPRGARPVFGRAGGSAGAFQSTRPRGARLLSLTSDTAKTRFQSTRPRGARHNPAGGGGDSGGFNPRAREGRDLHETRLFISTAVSIHAPARGATFVPANRRASAAFQSTRPRGARLRAAAHAALPAVSIHAPARGATRKMIIPFADSPFQSTRPRGARPRLSFAARQLDTFQSTRPRGARHRIPTVLKMATAVSIHAPARGAT